MRTSEQINELAAALSTAQNGFPQVIKTEIALAGSFKYRYADLASIIKTITPTLKDNGLSIVQTPGISETMGFYLSTRLMHKSGQWIEGEMPLPADKPPQQLGSALSYFRRYSLCSILNIMPDEDDDGAAATANHNHGSITNHHPIKYAVSQTAPSTETHEPPPPDGTPKPAATGMRPTKKQMDRLWAIAGDAGWSSKDVHDLIRTKLNIESVTQLLSRDYDRVCKFIENNPIEANGNILI